VPNPVRNEVHVDAILTNLSVGWMLGANNYLADQVFPVVPVAKQGGRYFVYDRGDFFRAEMERRGPGTESAGGGYRVAQDTYFADVWALHKDIADQDRANTDDPLDQDRDAASYLTQQALIRKEKQWVSKYFTTGVWTNDQTGVGAAPGANQFLQWNVSTSTPLADLRAQIIAVAKRTGYKPNTLVLGAETWNALADNASLVDRIKYTERAFIGPDILSAALGLDRVLIGNGIENTAAETNAASPQTFTGAFIAGKSAWLGYVAPAPSLQTPSAGYTFAWTGLEGANAMGGAVSKFRMDSLKSDRVEIEVAFDMKVVAADLGAFFATAVA
jgi:hypothetical protein